MVDRNPFAGSFSGTSVLSNTIYANTSMIKIGSESSSTAYITRDRIVDVSLSVAYGTMTWGSDNSTADRTSFGLVDGNVFTSGPAVGTSPGYFGFGIAVAGGSLQISLERPRVLRKSPSGVNNATVLSGNVFKSANFAGIASSSCTSTTPPTPGALYFDPSNTPGANLRTGFVSASLSFLICLGPTVVMSVVGYSSS